MGDATTMLQVLDAMDGVDVANVVTIKQPIIFVSLVIGSVENEGMVTGYGSSIT